MPTDYDRDVYAQPPTKSAVVDRGPYDLTKLLVKAFYYVVDLPVTTLHGIERLLNKIYYYHRRVNRVPDITQCIVGDYICQYEAEVQWHRDWLVDKEIVKVVQERLQACHVREGPDSEEMCREDVEKFEKAMKAFNCRNIFVKRCILKGSHFPRIMNMGPLEN
uniref:NADH dehydrogenase [ubiquinone] 1 beta subcomplex subunit 10 n=1 Tax=Eptatretus burgeri TaxID=7764 RepID=A0A8C4NLN4_EPTBU